jgi:hypothetical protein
METAHSKFIGKKLAVDIPHEVYRKPQVMWKCLFLNVNMNRPWWAWARVLMIFFLPLFMTLKQWALFIYLFIYFFYVCTMHIYTTKVYYSPMNSRVFVLKTLLKFTLKYLRHVSVQSHCLQGVHPCLLKLHFVKIFNYGLSVYD